MGQRNKLGPLLGSRGSSGLSEGEVMPTPWLGLGGKQQIDLLLGGGLRWGWVGVRWGALWLSFGGGGPSEPQPQNWEWIHTERGLSS